MTATNKILKDKITEKSKVQYKVKDEPIGKTFKMVKCVPAVDTTPKIKFDNDFWESPFMAKNKVVQKRERTFSDAKESDKSKSPNKLSKRGQYYLASKNSCSLVIETELNPPTFDKIKLFAQIGWIFEKDLYINSVGEIWNISLHLRKEILLHF